MKYLVLLTLLVAISCRTVPTDPRPVKQGVFLGNVRKAPISPIEHEGMDNSAPLASATLRFVSAKLDTTIVSDSGGHFALLVPAGSYSVIAQEMPDKWPTPPAPFDATVGMSSNDTVALNIDYETHIR